MSGKVRAEVTPHLRGWRVAIIEPQDAYFLTVRPNRPWVYWRPFKWWALWLAARRVSKRRRQRERLAKAAIHV